MEISMDNTRLEKIIDYAFGLFLFFSFISISISQLFLVLTILLYIYYAIRFRKDISFEIPLSLKIVLILYFWAFVITFFHENKIENFKEMREIWLYFPLFLMANYYWNRREQIKRLFSFFLWGAFISGIVGILEFFTYIDAKNLLKYGFTHGLNHPKIHLHPKMGGGEITGFMGNPLTYAGIMIIPVLYYFLQYFYSDSERKKISDKYSWFYRSHLWILYYFNLFGSGSRSGILGIIGSMALAALTYSRKVFFIFLSLSVILIGGYLAISDSARVRMENIFTQKEKGIQQRFITYQVAIKIIQNDPFIGKGPMNFEAEYKKYFPKVRSFRHAHNDILQKGISWGIPGLILFLALYFLPGWRFFRLIYHEDRVISFYGALALFTIVAFFIAGLFQCYLTDSEDMVHFAFILGVGEAAYRKAKKG